MKEIPPYQQKPEKTLNYKQKVLAGQIKGGLRSVSIHKRKELDRYARLSKQWLEGKTCELCETDQNLSLHHKNGRGIFLNIVEYWACLCTSDSSEFMKRKFPDSNHSHSGGCHGWVHGNSKLARELGLITNY